MSRDANVADNVNAAPPVRFRGRFGLTGTILILGSILLFTAFWADALSSSFSLLTIRQAFFCRDFRHWPIEVAYPLWTLFGLLLFDTLTRRPRTSETIWRDAILFSVNMGFVFLFLYFVASLFFVFHVGWIRWYTFNLALLLFFLVQWYVMYRTRKRDFSQTELLVRWKFLIMSWVITGELLLIPILQAFGLYRLLSYSLWLWFGLGAYSHRAALTFFLLCVATVIAVYVVKEWLVSLRKARAMNLEQHDHKATEVRS